MQVLELQANACWPFQAEDALRILMVQHGHGRVVFVVAGVKRARHRHLLEARHHTSRCDLAAGRNQRHLVPHANAHLACQLLAEHDVEAAGLQQLQHIGIRRCQIGHLAFARRINAAHDGALHVLTACNQALRCHKRRCAHHLRVLPCLLYGGVYIHHGLAIGRKDFDVRDHAEHAVAHFLLEAVHHTQHNDQRCHAQRNAEHGDTGNKGNKTIAPCGAACAGVAPAQSEFVGNLHTWTPLWHCSKGQHVRSLQRRPSGLGTIPAYVVPCPA